MRVARRRVLRTRRRGEVPSDRMRQRAPESRRGSAWLGPLDSLYRKDVCFNVFNEFMGVKNGWHGDTPCPKMLPMRMGAASCGAGQYRRHWCGVEGGTVLKNHFSHTICVVISKKRN